MKKLFVVWCALALAGCAAPRLETRFAGERVVLLRDGAELRFEDCLAEQLHRHGAMREEDLLKLCFQAAYGPVHILGRRAEAEKRFRSEFSAAEPRSGEPLFEVISPDFVRVNLGAWKAAGLPPEWLFELFAASAHEFGDGGAVLERYLASTERMLPKGLSRERFATLRRNGSGAPHHSEAYRRAERPSYRLVSTRLLNTLPVLVKAAKLPPREVRVIAIDGRAASGKTTLARQLAAVLKAEVIHMDDFFLPSELRTTERYRTPGGNVHHERFAAEVLPRLAVRKQFAYRVFDCSQMRLGGTREIGVSAWRIVEGAYALHPAFGDYAALKVFYDIAPEEQMRRIRERNGEAGARMFRDRWIPLEELYIREYRPRRRADVVLGR